MDSRCERSRQQLRRYAGNGGAEALINLLPFSHRRVELVMRLSRPALEATTQCQSRRVTTEVLEKCGVVDSMSESEAKRPIQLDQPAERVPIPGDDSCRDRATHVCRQLRQQPLPVFRSAVVVQPALARQQQQAPHLSTVETLDRSGPVARSPIAGSDHDPVLQGQRRLNPQHRVNGA